MVRYIAELTVPAIVVIIILIGLIEKKNILELFAKRSL